MAEWTSPISPTSSARRPSARWLGRIAATVFARLLRWQERAEERHALEALNEHMLKDIGVSRSDAIAEARKPFWRE
jgi:uncharacterized protein YjiS (DUF1127 family)